MICELKDKVAQFEKERILFMEDLAKLEKLYLMRVIDDKGDLLPFDPDENEEM